MSSRASLNFKIPASNPTSSTSTQFNPYIKALQMFLCSSDPLESYQAFMTSFVHFSTAFSMRWQLPLLKTMCDYLLDISRNMDKYSQNKGTKSSFQSQAQNQLARFLALILSERSSEETKSATLLIGISSIKLCFMMQELHICPKIIAQIENQFERASVKFSEFPKSHQITYKYYVGRVNIYHHEFSAADESLTFAFNNCQKHHVSNQKLIMSYLIAIRFVRGCLPTKQTLYKFGLEAQYLNLVEAYKQGNFNLFEQHLMQNSEWFLKKRLFMIMKERTKLLMFRNLFIRCFKVTQSQGQKNHIAIDTLLKGVLLLMPDMTMMDVECMIVSLIDQGYIKGYIVHGRNILVLSKNSSPFPQPYMVSTSNSKK